MKVLVLTLPTGQGHHSTGQAIVEYIEKTGNEAKLLDAYEYISPIISKSVSKGYLLSTKYTKRLYGKIYRKEEKTDLTQKSNIASSTNHMLGQFLKSGIDLYAPDVIVCTHVLATQLVGKYLKSNLKKPVHTIGIITDFTIHPFWEGANLDYYVTASELLKNQIRKKKIPEERVRAFGIPIKEKFAEKMSKEDAKKALGIDNVPAVLVMSGSMGYGNVVSQIKALDALKIDFQMIVACGNNKALKRRVDRLKTKKTVWSYGFTDKIDLMMDACECIITKPGGLSVSESLAKGIPMILMNPIPGQEDRNLEFLLNNGLAQYITDTYPVDEAVYQLLTSEFLMENQKKAMELVAKPNATRDLCEFILEVGNEHLAESRKNN